jgi:hypothetical protein
VSISGSGLADGKLTFNSAKMAKPVELDLKDLSDLSWMEVGKGTMEGGHALRLCLKGSQTDRGEG